MSRKVCALAAAAPAVALSWLLYVVSDRSPSVAPQVDGERHRGGAFDESSTEDVLVRSARPLPPGGPAENPCPHIAALPMTLEQARKAFPPGTDMSMFTRNSAAPARQVVR